MVQNCLNFILFPTVRFISDDEFSNHIRSTHRIYAQITRHSVFWIRKSIVFLSLHFSLMSLCLCIFFHRLIFFFCLFLSCFMSFTVWFLLIVFLLFLFVGIFELFLLPCLFSRIDFHFICRWIFLKNEKKKMISKIFECFIQTFLHRYDQIARKLWILQMNWERTFLDKFWLFRVIDTTKCTLGCSEKNKIKKAYFFINILSRKWKKNHVLICYQCVPNYRKTVVSDRY